MNVDGKHYRSIWLNPDDPSIVQTIDQRVLPHRFLIHDLKTWRDGQIGSKFKDENLSYMYDPRKSGGVGTDVPLAADQKGEGENSDNHGPDEGQNVMFVGDYHVQ